MSWLAVSDSLVGTCLAKGSNYCHYHNEILPNLLKILYWAIVNKTEVFLFSLQIYEELSISQYPAFLPSNVMFFQSMLMLYQSGAMPSASSCSLQSQKSQKTSVTAFTQSTKPPAILDHVGQFRLVMVPFLVSVRTAHNVCCSAFCYSISLPNKGSFFFMRRTLHCDKNLPHPTCPS